MADGARGADAFLRSPFVIRSMARPGGNAHEHTHRISPPRPGRVAGQHLLEDDPLRAAVVPDRGRLGLRGDVEPDDLRPGHPKNEGDYNTDLERLAREGKDSFAIYDALTRKDIAEGADAFRALHDRNPVDGWISLEVLPSLAAETEKTVAEAKRLSSTLCAPERLHQGARDTGRRSRDPPPDRRGDLHQHHAHVQPQALPRGRERVPRRPFGLRGERGRPPARPLGRVLLRLARRHARRQAPRREDPEGLGGRKRRGSRASSARRVSRTRRSSTRTFSRSSTPRRSPPSARRARASSGRSGRPRARKTPPTPTSFTSRTSSAPTP